ncbi:hypothetical protein D9M68_630080 [compost metagenome]|uniref:DUF202 domain-containing protein n=1 Tax=Pseudomonas jinjuensis TaxID=198616 RepID=UPI000A000408|nr:DUF202 domain-containing protein [Pseudomonas jinjuensis]
MSGRNSGRAAPLHSDDGLQPERTSLAWGRTLLALVVTACFFLRWMHSQGWLGAGLAMACLLLGVFVWVALRLRYRAGAAGIRNNRLAPALSSVLLVGLGVTTMAALSIWAAVRI